MSRESAVRIERVNGRKLAVAGMGPVHAGSVWAPADGGNRTVTVAGCADGVVRYTDPIDGSVHECAEHKFKVRYCLVLEDI
jgi:hypothetical protein